MTEWVSVARTEDVPEGTMVGSEVGGVRLLVANVEGRYSAMGAVCSHESGPLADGELDGNIVTCPWHGGRFNVETGEAVGPPPETDEPVYEVRVAADEIQVAKPEV